GAKATRRAANQKFFHQRSLRRREQKFWCSRCEALAAATDRATMKSQERTKNKKQHRPGCEADGAIRWAACPPGQPGPTPPQRLRSRRPLWLLIWLPSLPQQGATKLLK